MFQPPAKNWVFALLPVSSALSGKISGIFYLTFFMFYILFSRLRQKIHTVFLTGAAPHYPLHEVDR
jgi:hypothetical protein